MKKFNLKCLGIILFLLVTGCSSPDLDYYIEYTEIKNVEENVQEWFSKYEKDGIYLARNKEKSIVYFYVKSDVGQDNKYKNFSIGIQGNTSERDTFSMFTESYITNQPSDKVVVLYLDADEVGTIKFNDDELKIESIDLIK